MFTPNKSTRPADPAEWFYEARAAHNRAVEHVKECASASFDAEMATWDYDTDQANRARQASRLPADSPARAAIEARIARAEKYDQAELAKALAEAEVAHRAAIAALKEAQAELQTARAATKGESLD